MDDVTACDESGVYLPANHWANNNEPTVTKTGPRRNRAEAHQRGDALDALFGNEQLIYAVRLADGVIKIGCTENIRQRRNWLRGDIIGLMPGTFADELKIHRSLRPHVNRGREYYNPTPEVIAVVNEMREHFNLEPLAA